MDLVEAANEVGSINAMFAASSDEAGEMLAEMIRPGDAVLIKGSRGVRTELVIEKLLSKFELEEERDSQTR